MVVNTAKDSCDISKVSPEVDSDQFQDELEVDKANTMSPTSTTVSNSC